MSFHQTMEGRGGGYLGMHAKTSEGKGRVKGKDVLQPKSGGKKLA